jgi:hypothetical protein
MTDCPRSNYSGIPELEDEFFAKARRHHRNRLERGARKPAPHPASSIFGEPGLTASRWKWWWSIAVSATLAEPPSRSQEIIPRMTGIAPLRKGAHIWGQPVRTPFVIIEANERRALHFAAYSRVSSEASAYQGM